MAPEVHLDPSLSSIWRLLAGLDSTSDSICFVGDSIMLQWFYAFVFEAHRVRVGSTEPVEVRLYEESDVHPHPWSRCLWQYMYSEIGPYKAKYYQEYILFKEDLELVDRHGNCGVVLANLGAHYDARCMWNGKVVEMQSAA